ncbi:hypothetical protein ACFO3D_15170 [Virgibacillus kekensis]|uniref:Transporter n=1 Tax=Virgibacillus kekensis TaxID=202261 RepID=A0ABV9DME6_9BACI
MNYNQPPNGNQQRNFPGFLNNLFGGGFPGGGQPFGPPGGGPPLGVPGGGPQQPAGAPTSPPPSFTPSQQQAQTFGTGQFGVYAVDPGAIRGCLYRFTYIWLRWDSFWFFPVFVGRRSISGFRWYRNRWVYYGVDLDNIESFQCY